jgi:hypothetical protein
MQIDKAKGSPSMFGDIVLIAGVLILGAGWAHARALGEAGRIDLESIEEY